MRDALELARNELARAVLRRGVWAVGHAARLEIRYRVATYRRAQARLRRGYGVTDGTPVRTYDAAVRAAVEAYAARHADAHFAYTSGSTAEPKKIAFTRQRLRAIKRGNLAVVAQTLLRYRVPRPGLFILSGLKEDDSLSSLLLSDRGRAPPYLSGLLMPARYLTQPALAPALAHYGPTAVRLWLLILTNPGILYSTNPSTLALFLTDVHEDWAQATSLVRDFVADDSAFGVEVARVARRVAAPGWRSRAARVAEAPAPLPVAEWLPGLGVYCCWDGGYVRPFLDRIRAFLPADRFHLVPMYSMATETIETVSYFDGDGARFLALAPGVLYEFLPDEAADDPAALIAGPDLVAGRAYTMVVSDPYGLCRYQTEDVFFCAGKVGDVPDLRFLRRRGLAYSFTGEKLTDQQVLAAFAELREAFPALGADAVQLALVPSQPRGARVPRYRLALAYPSAHRPAVADQARAIAARFDAILGVINRELAAKHASGRLGPTVAAVLPYDELAAHLDPKTRDAADRAGRVWDTQFKLLPLYQRLWHAYGLADD
jgi:hypothetical protein